MKIDKLFLTNINFVIISGFLHGFLFLLPALAILCIIPFIALIFSEKPCLRKIYLWGLFSYIGTIWWMAFVDIEGLRALIVGGTFLLSAFFGLKYLLIGGISSIVVKKSPRIAFLFIPSLWVLTDYGMLFGAMSFPWAFDGYLVSQIGGISQLASVTGVWGLTFLAVIFAVVLYERQKKKILVLSVILILISIWGFSRMKPVEFFEEKALVMQPNTDQGNWHGTISLMQSMDVLDSLFAASLELERGIYILPESAIFTYLQFRPLVQIMLENWLEFYDSPIIFGTLQPILDEDENLISAFNTAIFAEPRYHNNLENFRKYYKQKLVPFVETMPFASIFPLISRLDLGGGRFTAGVENSVWQTGNLNAAPMICYESIYPNFARRRVNNGANVLVNITNDGWFGRTTAPYQHAEMSRVRAVENGVSIVRSANSGISFSADPYGRYLGKTQLYTREIVEMPIAKPLKNTIYRQFGDWFVYLCGIFAAVVIIRLIYSVGRRK